MIINAIASRALMLLNSTYQTDIREVLSYLVPHRLEPWVLTQGLGFGIPKTMSGCERVNKCMSVVERGFKTTLGDRCSISTATLIAVETTVRPQDP